MRRRSQVLNRTPITVPLVSSQPHFHMNINVTRKILRLKAVKVSLWIRISSLEADWQRLRPKMDGFHKKRSQVYLCRYNKKWIFSIPSRANSSRTLCYLNNPQLYVFFFHTDGFPTFLQIRIYWIKTEMKLFFIRKCSSLNHYCFSNKFRSSCNTFDWKYWEVKRERSLHAFNKYY